MANKDKGGNSSKKSKGSFKKKTEKTEYQRERDALKTMSKSQRRRLA